MEKYYLKYINYIKIICLSCKSRTKFISLGGGYSKYCSITLKSNGEIILKPSQTAVIKIGGEDANKAILCTENAFESNGNVSASPIITNGGQAIGSTGGINGVFASKILIK